ncbi:Dynein intermediate chain CFAP94 axonemal [Taenia crassiceps]|uniref:Dynein intermediate chain CFAP94 axonemal n=1 Tax=Taenia crassiceps TaxID=6207 RepID=A0ABR4QLX2_9CEST
MPKLIRKEEEARKKEEEKRLAAEKEAASKAAEKLAELQCRHALEIAELKFRKAELDETRELLSRHHQALDKIQRERADDYIWYRYLLCDGLPNPIIEKEINTYMSLWRTNEDRISMDDIMVDSVNAMKVDFVFFDKISFLMQLIDELQTLIADLDENYSELERYRQVMQELRELVQEKVNRACVETLTKASHFADPETANLQKYWHNNWLSLCIWGNLSKNPRIKRYTFEETGITFSIPRLLTLSDCAFRILFMKFDTYSVTSLSYRPRVYNSSEEKTSSIATIEGVPKDVVDSSIAALRGESTSAGDKKEGGMSRKSELKEEQGKKEGKQTGGEAGGEEWSVDEVGTTKPKAKLSVNSFDIWSEEQKGIEEEEVVEIPEEDRVETPTKPLWSPIPLPEDAIDLCDYHVVGGVFQFDLLKLPRQPRMGRGWRWTNCVVPPLLAPFEYIVDTPPLEDEETESEMEREDRVEETKEGQEGEAEGVEDTVAEGVEVTTANTDGAVRPYATRVRKIEAPEPNPPVEVKLRLPDCLIIPEEPVLACWDPENLIWRTNGIVINQFTPELNEISFITAVFGTFAVFQDFHLNMPFQYWEMRPLPRQVIRAQTQTAEVATNKSSDEDVEPLPLDSSTSPGPANTAQQPPRRASHADSAPQAPPSSQQPTSVDAAAPSEAVAVKGGEVASIVANADAGLATALPPLRPPPPQQMPAQTDALGPLDSMGVPDAIFLADKTEADQCLITITGAYIRVQLHVLDDRVAIVAEDPKAILDPLKMAEEEAAAAAKAAGVAMAPTAASDEAVDEAAIAAPTTARRRFGGGGAAGPRASRVGATTGAVTDNALGRQLELEHLTGRWFTPDELICVLTASGVNIFPRPDSGTRVECIEKNPLTEQRLYEQMALLSPVMAFGWSHWNSACQDPNNIIIVGAEHLDDDGPVDEDRWKVYSMNRRYVCQLQIPESGDKFSPDPEPTLHCHADFYHMYMEIGSEKGKERVQGIQTRYFKTVHRILRSIRLPVFS